MRVVHAVCILMSTSHKAGLHMGLPLIKSLLTHSLLENLLPSISAETEAEHIYIYIRIFSFPSPFAIGPYQVTIQQMIIYWQSPFKKGAHISKGRFNTQPLNSRKLDVDGFMGLR